MPESAWNFYPHHSHPVTALDIVWCRFPFVEDPQNPAPKPRPALVNKVRRTNAGLYYVTVAYGTSNPEKYSGRDLFIRNAADMAKFGLPQATTFLLDRMETLPWATEWFTVRETDGRGPVVGHLDERYEEYLRVIRKSPPSGSN